MSLLTINLVLRQVFLKLSISRFSDFGINLNTFIQSFKNLYVFLAFLSFVYGLLLWVYVLSIYQFNRVYPLVSMSYLYGLLAARFVFRESIPKNRVYGVIIIIAGVVLVTIK